MINKTDENGIFGYENSKQKKIKNTLYDYNNLGEKLTSPLTEEQRSAMINDAQAASAAMDYEQSMLSAPIDKTTRMEQYNKGARNFLVPSPNDALRRRRLFATSDRTVQGAAEELYQNGVKDIFMKERDAAEQRARKEYANYATVAGADGMAALGALRREAAPERVMDSTMHKIDDAALDRMAERYAAYAQMSPQQYRKEVLEPRLRQRLYEEYVKDATPKSSAEYVARSAYNNSLTGKLMDFNLNALSQTNSQNLIDREGLAAYDANRFENLAGGIGSLLVDMPMFAGIGNASLGAVKGIAGIAKNLSSSLAKKYAAKGLQAPVAERVVEQALKKGLAAKIVGSSATQALTLGGYDAGNSVADDLLLNEGVDIEKAVKAYGKGLATGAAVGLVGTPLKMKSRGLTGGKKVAASAGILGAESAVFTAGTELDKLSAGVDVEPIDLLYDFGESAATLGAMRLAHWRPRGGYAKLSANGKLKKELAFTSTEQGEMMEAGVNPEHFVSMLESILATAPKEASKRTAEIKDNYLQMMSSEKLSAATRSKLLYLVEDKISSTPLIPFAYTIEKNPAGSSRISLLDANGKRIKTTDNLTDAQLKNAVMQVDGVVRRNKIATCEAELIGEFDSDNFFSQVRRYANEKGADVSQIVDVMYKAANKEPLNSTESNLLGEISHRTGLGDKRVGYLLQKMRRGLENKYGLEEGALLNAIDRRANYISDAENRALDEYLENLKTEVEIVREGVDEARLRAIDNEMASSSYGDQTNYEVKLSERRNYLDGSRERGEVPLTPEVMDNQMEFPVEVPTNWTKPYAWSVRGVRNTPKDIQNLETRARELSERLGLELNFIYDERSIPFDGNNVAAYNDKISSLGWVDNRNGKVYINLPNVRDIHELEKTFVHEAIGHKGLSNLLGEYLYDFYEDIYNRAAPELRSEIHKSAQRNGLEGYSAIGEYLAELAERNMLSPKENSLLNHFKGFLNRALVNKRIFSPDNNNITKADLQDFLAAHQRAMLKQRHPDGYRSSVLRKFPSLNNGVTDFYNRAEHERYLQERYPDAQQALAETPNFLFDEKRNMLDDIQSFQQENAPESYRLIGSRGAKRLGKSREYKNYLKSTDPGDVVLQILKGNTNTWESTGWSLGADGKWRTEIGEEELKVRNLATMVLEQRNPVVANLYMDIMGNSNVEITPKQEKFLDALCNNYKRIFKGVDIRMHHLVEDPLFFTAYPRLANVKVKVTDKITTPCKYNPKSRILYVTPETIIKRSDLKHQIVPQMQYMIQQQEGFAGPINLMDIDKDKLIQNDYENAMDMVRVVKGLKNSNYESLSDVMEMLFHDRYKLMPDDFVKMFPTGNDYLLFTLLKKPYAHSSDVEARNAYKRQFMSPNVRDVISPRHSEALPRKLQVRFEKLSDAMKFLSGPLDEIYRYKNFEAYGFPREWADPEDEIINADLGKKFMSKLRKGSPAYEFFDRHRHAYIKKMARQLLQEKDVYPVDDEWARKNSMYLDLHSGYYDDEKGEVISGASMKKEAQRRAIPQYNEDGTKKTEKQIERERVSKLIDKAIDDYMSGKTKRIKKVEAPYNNILIQRYEDKLRKDLDLNDDFKIFDDNYLDDIGN